jgi:hypothetical protein
MQMLLLILMLMSALLLAKQLQIHGQLVCTGGLTNRSMQYQRLSAVNRLLGAGSPVDHPMLTKVACINIPKISGNAHLHVCLVLQVAAAVAMINALSIDAVDEDGNPEPFSSAEIANAALERHFQVLEVS